MRRDTLHKVLFGALVVIGLITIWGMIQDGEWDNAATAIVSVVGTILTLEVTKPEKQS